MTRLLSITLVLLLAAGCDGSPATPDSGTTRDSGTPREDAGTRDAGAGEDAGSPLDAGSDAGTTTPSCGSDRPDVSGISGTEGLVIARDGTIYYSQSGGVGRLTPGGTQEDDWVSIAGASTVWGLALDAANESLYVAVPSAGNVSRIDLSAASPSATTFVSGAGQPNGMTIGPDGALYYSDFGGGRVYRVELGGATGTRVEVTASTIDGANGVAFLADGTLLVASYSDGELLRLTLSAGVETARERFASVPGNPDGVAVDEDGRVYASANSSGRVLRFEPDGTGSMTIDMGIPSAASLEFGAGPLDCHDLYVASASELVRYEMGTAAGAAVPWH